jgi:hypothetical protein
MDPSRRLAPLASLLLALALPSQEADRHHGYEAAVRAGLAQAQAAMERSVVVAEDHSAWDKAWEVSSAHYTVRTTHSHWLASQLASGLDRMLQHFTSILAPAFQPGERFIVHVFPDIALYNSFGEQFGAHHSSIYGSFFAAGSAPPVVAAIQDPNITRLQMAVTHSAYHQFAARAFPGQTIAAWIDEGLASYFSLYWAPEYGIDEHRRLLETDKFVPLPRLLGANVDAYGDNAHDRFMELGMLFTWLLHYREDTRLPAEAERAENPGRFASYLRTVLRGQRVQDKAMVDLVNDRASLEAGFRAEKFGR